MSKTSEHLTIAERYAPTINLWLTAIFNVFDRVIANRQTLADYVVRIHRIHGRQQ